MKIRIVNGQLFERVDGKKSQGLLCPWASIVRHNKACSLECPLVEIRQGKFGLVVSWSCGGQRVTADVVECS